MELPEKLIIKHKEDTAKIKELENKKKSREMFKRRKLDKAIKSYVKSKNGSLNSNDINNIGEKYGFHFG